MATVLSTLYPPLVDTFQSPFIYTDDAKVIFTISPYNSYKEIKRLHVTLVNQRTNQNVFASNNLIEDDGTVLTNGVWIVPFDIDDDNSYLTGDHNKNYYVLTIPTTLLKQTAGSQNTTYVCNCYYKVQIRFDNYNLENEDIINNKYLQDKRAHFSEWSSVTLLKAIPEVSVKLTNFDTDSLDGKLKIPQYSQGIIPFTGTVFFTPSETGEHLESYNIEIVDSNEKIIKESGLQYVTEDVNTFNWICDLTDTPINKNYYAKLYLSTNNNYNIYKKYKFRLVDFSGLEFNPIWDFNKIKIPYEENNKEILVTSEDGWVTITITVPGILPSGYLFIKRANSLNNYSDWEIIDCTYFADGSQITKTFIDKTVGSLIDYKYSCQYLTTSNIWSKTIKTSEIVYPDFYDTLILRGDKQLAIRYNEQITSMTPVVNRVKIDTLGGKYPRFAENARMHYKQFQISGIISAEGDYNRKFISDLDYKNEINIYDREMNGKHIIRNDTFISSSPTNKGIQTQHNTYPIDNWWWERKFREEVIEWLNDGEPKLYRSMTEGNMIVMFDSINLTPNPQLGRRIWNFSATVYEVGDGYSLNDLDSLGIFSIKNDYNLKYNITEENNSFLKTWVGQARDYDNITFMDYLTKEIQDFYSGAYKDYTVDKKSLYLTDVTISFNSKPQWYDLFSMNLKSSDNEDLSLSTGNQRHELEYDDEIKQYVIK